MLCIFFAHQPIILIYYRLSSTYSSVSYQQYIYTTLIHQPIHPSLINHLSILPSFINLFIRLLSTIYLYYPHSSTYSSVSYQPFIYTTFIHQHIHSFVYTSLLHQPIHPSPINHYLCILSFINLFNRISSTIYLCFPRSLTFTFISYQPFTYTSFIHKPIHPSPINHLSLYSMLLNQPFTLPQAFLPCFPIFSNFLIKLRFNLDFSFTSFSSCLKIDVYNENIKSIK